MVNPPVGEPSKIDRPSAPVSLTATSLTSLMFSLIGGATPVGQALVTLSVDIHRGASPGLPRHGRRAPRIATQITPNLRCCRWRWTSAHRGLFGSKGSD